jgi:hypothetical protein
MDIVADYWILGLQRAFCFIWIIHQQMMFAFEYKWHNSRYGKCDDILAE